MERLHHFSWCCCCYLYVPIVVDLIFTHSLIKFRCAMFFAIIQLCMDTSHVYEMFVFAYSSQGDTIFIISFNLSIVWLGFHPLLFFPTSSCLSFFLMTSCSSFSFDEPLVYLPSQAYQNVKISLINKPSSCRNCSRK